jgi:hypothetical protein
MNLKHTLLVCSMIGMHVVASGQESAIGKGASLIKGLAGFTSTGYGPNIKRSNVLTISPAMDYFLLDHFFVGGALNYENTNSESFNTSMFGIGPEIGYAFGSQTSIVFPYLTAGWNFQKSKTDFLISNSTITTNNSGNGISLGLGVIIPVKSHLGIVVEGKYNMYSFSNTNNLSINKTSDNSNVISFNFGIVGMLF